MELSTLVNKHWFSLILLGTGFCSTGAWSTDDIFCAQYAKQAIAQFEKGKAASCPNLNPPVWSANYERHAGWCNRVPRGQAEAGTKQRQQVLDACLASAKKPAPGGGTSGQSGGKVDQCGRYARTAVQQSEENINKGCGFRGPVWSSDYGHHYNWCVHGENVQHAASGTSRRKEALQRCVAGAPGGGDGPRAAQCERYAKEAVAQNQQNIENKCGFKGLEWRSDYAHHYDWCVHGENVRHAAAGTGRRAEALQRCTARTPAGGASRKAECERYAKEALAQNGQNIENKCGFKGPEWRSDYGHHYNWCAVGKNVKRAAEGTKRRAEALKRCNARAGGVGGRDEQIKLVQNYRRPLTIGRVTYPLSMYYLERAFSGIQPANEMDRRFSELIRKSPAHEKIYHDMLEGYRSLSYDQKRSMFDENVLTMTASPNNPIRTADIDRAFRVAMTDPNWKRLKGSYAIPTPKRPISLRAQNYTDYPDDSSPGYVIKLWWHRDEPKPPHGYAIYRWKPDNKTQARVIATIPGDQLSYMDRDLPIPSHQDDAFCYNVRAYIKPTLTVVGRANRVESQPTEDACATFAPNSHPPDTDRDGIPDPVDWCPEDGETANIPRVYGCLDEDKDGFPEGVQDPAFPSQWRDHCPRWFGEGDFGPDADDGYKEVRGFEPLPGCAVKYQIRWMGLEILSEPIDCVAAFGDIDCDQRIGLGNEYSQVNETIRGQELPPGFEPYLVFTTVNGVKADGYESTGTKQWCCGEGVSVGSVMLKDLRHPQVHPGGIEPDNDYRGAENPDIDAQVQKNGMVLWPALEYFPIKKHALVLTWTLLERDFDREVTPENNEDKAAKAIENQLQFLSEIGKCGVSEGLGCGEEVAKKLVDGLLAALIIKKPEPVIVADRDDVMGIESRVFTPDEADGLTAQTGVYAFYQKIPLIVPWAWQRVSGIDPEERFSATMVGRVKMCLVRKGVDKNRVRELCRL